MQILESTCCKNPFGTAILENILSQASVKQPVFPFRPTRAIWPLLFPSRIFPTRSRSFRRVSTRELGLTYHGTSFRANTFPITFDRLSSPTKSSNFIFLWFLRFPEGVEAWWKTWIISKYIIKLTHSSESKNVKLVQWFHWKKCTWIPCKAIKFILAQLDAIVIHYIDTRYYI